MKFNAVINKEGGCVLSVSGQCGGSSAVSFACIISMCFVQRFPAASLFVLAFGSFFLFFYPHPSSPFLFPLINQCDKSLARIYQGLAYSRRSVSRVRCSDDGERVKSYAEETRGRKWGDSGASSLPFPFSLPFFFPRQFFYRVLPFECLEQANQGLAFPKFEAPGQTRHPPPLNDAVVEERWNIC